MDTLQRRAFQTRPRELWEELLLSLTVYLWFSQTVFNSCYAFVIPDTVFRLTWIRALRGFNSFMPEVVTVYYDYVCPFAWRGAELAEQIAPVLGLTFEWRHFSLYQNNYAGGNGWQLWNQKLSFDDDGGDKGLLPFMASCAARRQGGDKHAVFRLELMRARHRDHKPFSLETMRGVAEVAALDVSRFESDLANPECRTVLAHEHHHAVSQDIFGTPTFSFEGGHTAYLRLKALPCSAEEAADLFTGYRAMLERYPYLETIKRPRSRGN